MKPVKMATKQSTLLLLIFFSLVLVSSSSEGGELLGKRYSVARFSTIHAGHGGSSGGGGSGGGSSGGRDSGGEGSQGDASGSRDPNGAGAANMNHHRHGTSSRVQGSVFLTWIVVVFAAQFSAQVL